ncbi:hypothetical protein [Yinghuangia soli]|jgi:hypothetical protein|uniref:Uncharacterized protein n=1 Tax=Yinghuangia soli TaxID=2908204 RepID=A0AA41TWR5_9ACTN|nr:hypothetical protein [Yinghuangia soli]MCF2526108.1 hypothetical protein [Yinghuangia soli]
MKIGDQVAAGTDIESWSKPYVPRDAAGVVTDVGFRGVSVAFTVPGLLGGTRQVTVTVRPEQLIPL